MVQSSGSLRPSYFTAFTVSQGSEKGYLSLSDRARWGSLILALATSFLISICPLWLCPPKTAFFMREKRGSISYTSTPHINASYHEADHLSVC